MVLVGTGIRWVIETDPVVGVLRLVFLGLFVSGHTVFQPSVKLTVITTDSTRHMITCTKNQINLTENPTEQLIVRMDINEDNVGFAEPIRDSRKTRIQNGFSKAVSASFRACPVSTA